VIITQVKPEPRSYPISIALNEREVVALEGELRRMLSGAVNLQYDYPALYKLWEGVDATGPNGGCSYHQASLV
jgi:hypothetical protein